MQSGPIGIFDSGYGGLTVFRSITKRLPQYDYIYLGDNARSPYGTRSLESIYQYTLESVKFLFQKSCPLIVLACNTASAKALRNIQQKDLPTISPDRRVLGVIRPTAEIIGNYSKTGHVGILGTPGTINSQSYLMEIQKFFPHLNVVQEACPMWVPLVENNELDNVGAAYFVKKHINNIFDRSNKIDTLLLGCTHYPLLTDLIKRFVSPDIQIIPQGDIVAESLMDYLVRHPEMGTRCTKEGSRVFFTTDSPEIFDDRAKIFYGDVVKSQYVKMF